MSFYNTNPDQPQFVTADWVRTNAGIDPDKATPEQLAAAGFYLMVVEPTPEYDPDLVSIEQEQGIVGTNYVVSYRLVPFATSTYTTSVKSQAYNILQPTDWLVVRKVENGAEIPEDWNAWRESIRVESQDKVTTIDTASEEELVAYVQSPAYTYWPPEPTTPKLA
jgi:hypothetical protein